MAAPIALDVSYTRGDSVPIPFTLTDLDGVAIDISGFTFELTVDPNPDPTDAGDNLFSLTGAITDAANGKFQFAPTIVQSDQTPDTYFYDIQMIDGSLAKQTIVKGKFTILPDITKT
jgi:hypothetical protein